MKKIKKKYKNLLFDLFAEGFDLVFGSSGKKQWYAGLLSDCEEDIDVVDWSKVPVDTLILVKSDDNCWYHRHFAKYEDGRIYAWRDGMTSWSLKSCDDDNIAYIYWEYAKLADNTSE